MKKIFVCFLLTMATISFADTFETKQEAADAAYSTAFQNGKETYLSPSDYRSLYDDIKRDLSQVILEQKELQVFTIKKGNFFTKKEYLVFQYKDQDDKIYTWIFKS
jgi:hypothetical protein